MQTRETRFNVQELFDSLTPHEQDEINRSVAENTLRREETRYDRLQDAEVARNKLVQELDHIEYETAENDDWFIAAKEHKVEVTSDALKTHRRRAEALYSRKKAIIDRLLPESESNIKAVVSQIESEEAQESLCKIEDMERLLLPFYEKREHARRQVIVAQTKERMRQREEEEARRRREYEALLNRLREEEFERRQNLAVERRQKRVEALREKVEARQIPYLVHFTPLANVESILEFGLMSRNALHNHRYVFTDEYRSDGWLDWISSSVSFPNYKMFYAKKNSLKDIDGWAVLLIKRDALWELDCKFILTNAASYGIRMFQDEKWSSVEAFEEMFNHVEHRNGIPEYFTTDPQAEVMIKKEIPRSFIGTIAVERPHDVDRLNGLTDIRVEVIPKLFSWRSDFEHWRKSRLSPFSSDKSQGVVF